MMSLPGPYLPRNCPTEDAACPLIVLEGVSGIGKSTLAQLLAEQLGAQSLHTLSEPHAKWARTVKGRLRPLPQFAFYLSGLLHASDTARTLRRNGPVIADRYVSSVIACHAAVHRVPVENVAELLAPFRPYLLRPKHTFYLRCSEQTLRDRMARKADIKPDDTELFSVPGRLPRLLANFQQVSESDPSAVTVDTDGRSPAELADIILDTMRGTRA
ncbi:AAA family ATPase [Streptomyces sp. NPDC091278]|uniref:dTMP kinase n=1 Tax=Streptomyces sp. NPDC091278 TaxID=3155301 RepID=UPI00344EC781